MSRLEITAGHSYLFRRVNTATGVARVLTHRESMTTQIRIDRLLVERGLFESRAKAQAAIAAGRVTADDVLITKASQDVSAVAVLQAEPAHPYVSRGGVKLAAALDHFRGDPIGDPRGRVCLDVGASTGGFTEVLLARGARRVYAVDVGRDQLHLRLRERPEIISIESTDIRRLDPVLLPERPNFVTIDASFISLRLLLPAVLELMQTPADLLALIKPQFEAGRTQVKKGIVRDPRVHAAVCDDIASFVTSRGWHVRGIVASPIAGGDGNREFFIGAHHA
jgi:23S rRNA (cytidine1920-2'-O)/16S rRNA (cytidine1409-2'-O)-methyltransferase